MGDVVLPGFVLELKLDGAEIEAKAKLISSIICIKESVTLKNNRKQI